MASEGCLDAPVESGMEWARSCGHEIMMNNWAPLNIQREVECYVAEPKAASPKVPPGYVVLDTAALAACAGDRALRRHETFINTNLFEEPSATIFRGINSAAPIRSQAMVHVPGGLVGRSARCGLRSFPTPTRRCCCQRRSWRTWGLRSTRHRRR